MVTDEGADVLALAGEIVLYLADYSLFARFYTDDVRFQDVAEVC